MIPEAAITHWRRVAPWPEGARVSRKEFENNLTDKLASHRFHEDLRLVLGPTARFDIREAAREVSERILTLL